MDEFEQADRSDAELDRADDWELRRADWDDLHGQTRSFVSLVEACTDWGRDRARAARDDRLDRLEEVTDG